MKFRFESCGINFVVQHGRKLGSKLEVFEIKFKWQNKIRFMMFGWSWDFPSPWIQWEELIFGWNLSNFFLIKFDKQMYQDVEECIENPVIPHKIQERVSKAF